MKIYCWRTRASPSILRQTFFFTFAEKNFVAISVVILSKELHFQDEKSVLAQVVVSMMMMMMICNRLGVDVCFCSSGNLFSSCHLLLLIFESSKLCSVQNLVLYLTVQLSEGVIEKKAELFLKYSLCCLGN